ncbi:MAG: hypothetical protein ACRD07_15655 [Acidimicrobiales bacterium]
MAHVGERWVRAGIGASVAAAALSALTLVAAAPAGAGGGDWLYPDRDRYEPGQQVTLVGHVAGYAYCPGELDPEWRGRGPFYAYLRVDPVLAEQPPAGCPDVHGTDVRVGELLIEERPGHPVEALRAGVTFTLPGDLAAGPYEVVVCNHPCTIGLGELLESTVYVGIDPPEPLVRDWPLDEPLVRYLDDSALLADPVCRGGCDDLDDWSVTAAEVRAGYRPAPTTVPPPPPEPEPAVATTSRPPVREPVGDTGTSPAGRAGADPAGGVSSEVVAWIMGFGAVLIVWCLAWRWRPREPRKVVRQVNGQHGPPASDDDPRPVHVKL